MTIANDITKIHLPQPKYKILKEISKRWSPRYFSDKPVSADHLNIIFEAARWAPSGHNDQPWYFYYAKKGTNSYDKLFSTLVDYNKSWAKTAPTLILACAITGDNPYAIYDLGAAVLSLILQAQSLGYHARQMALFDQEKVKQIFKLEKNLQPYTIIAMGKIGDHDKAPKEIIEFEISPRPRKKDFFKEL